MALENEIYIPHLCHYKGLPDTGSCGLCIVEVEGEVNTQYSCKLKVRDGMRIITKTEKIANIRRIAMEMLMAAHPEHCTGCVKYGVCEFQALTRNMEVTSGKMRRRSKKVHIADNDIFEYNMQKCVLCGRCVRICKVSCGKGILKYKKENGESYIAIDEEKFKDHLCNACGHKCAEVCPTAAIMTKKSFNEKNEV